MGERSRKECKYESQKVKLFTRGQGSYCHIIAGLRIEGEGRDVAVVEREDICEVFFYLGCPFRLVWAPPIP